MTDTDQSRPEARSFAEVALAGEDVRRAAERFPRPARTKFKRHAALFLVANVVLALGNALLMPGHWIFYYVTIVWAFILADNFLWAYVVDPDRDVAERKVLLAERDRLRNKGAQDSHPSDSTGG